MGYKHLIAALAASIAIAASAAPAAAPSSTQRVIVLKKDGHTLQDYRDAQGKPAKQLVPLTKIAPGDEIVYTIGFSHVGKVAVDQVVITDPIPYEVAYVDGSATGAGAEIDFSADGGKTFGKPAALRVRDADGRERAAVAADYTHIRWTLLARVAPGERGLVRYRATLR